MIVRAAVWLFSGDDRVRPVEFLAGLVALGFGLSTVLAPEMMDRAVYSELSGHERVSLFLMVLGVAELLATGRFAGPGRPIRCFLLAVSCAAWAGIAWAFLLSGVASTAVATYFAISLVCGGAALLLAAHKW